MASLSFDDIRGNFALRQELEGMFVVTSATDNLQFEAELESRMRFQALRALPASFGAKGFWAMWWAPWSRDKPRELSKDCAERMRADCSMEVLLEQHCANIVARQMACVQSSVRQKGVIHARQVPGLRDLHRMLAVPTPPFKYSTWQVNGLAGTGARSKAAPGRVLRDVPYLLRLGSAQDMLKAKTAPRSDSMRELVTSFVPLREWKRRILRPTAPDPRAQAAKGEMMWDEEHYFVMPEFSKMYQAWRGPYMHRREWMRHIEDMSARAREMHP